jgi:hypothetical protein
VPPRLTIAPNAPPPPNAVDQAAGEVIACLDRAVNRLTAQEIFAVFLRLLNHLAQRMTSMQLSGLEPEPPRAAS